MGSTRGTSRSTKPPSPRTHLPPRARCSWFYRQRVFEMYRVRGSAGAESRVIFQEWCGCMRPRLILKASRTCSPLHSCGDRVVLPCVVMQCWYRASGRATAPRAGGGVPALPAPTMQRRLPRGSRGSCSPGVAGSWPAAAGVAAVPLTLTLPVVAMGVLGSRIKRRARARGALAAASAPACTTGTATATGF